MSEDIFQHAPADYFCPFCALLKGIRRGDEPLSKPTDIVYQNDIVFWENVGV